MKYVRTSYSVSWEFPLCNVHGGQKREIDDTIKEFGTVHVALPSAGFVLPTFMIDPEGNPFNSDEFKQIIDTHIMGHAYVYKWATQQMVKNEPSEHNERGVLFGVSSSCGRHGTESVLAYSAAKAAIDGMQLPVARNLAPYGIRSVSLAPGAFMTPIAEFQTPEQRKFMCN